MHGVCVHHVHGTHRMAWAMTGYALALSCLARCALGVGQCTQDTVAIAYSRRKSAQVHVRARTRINAHICNAIHY